jgi:hypothetical protein
LRLPSNVRWTMATNRRKDKSGVGGVLAAFSNRVHVYGVMLPVDDWAEWAHGQKLPPELISYVRFKPDCLADPEKHSNADIEPFCSARTLEMAGQDMQAGITRYATLAATIGASRATELGAFIAVWRELPDVGEILARPEKAIVPKKDRPDIMYALVGSLAYHVTAKTVGNLTKYVVRLPKEFEIACMKDARAQKPDLRNAKAFREWLAANVDVLVPGTEDEGGDAAAE